MAPCQSSLSHSGVFPSSVAKLTSKPASLNAMYGTLVSVMVIIRHRFSLGLGETGRHTGGIMTIVSHHDQDSGRRHFRLYKYS